MLNVWPWERRYLDLVPWVHHLAAAVNRAPLLIIAHCSIDAVGLVARLIGADVRSADGEGVHLAKIVLIA